MGATGALHAREIAEMCRHGREDDLKPAFGELPLPTSFVIARDGSIYARHDGLTATEQVEREIAALL